MTVETEIATTLAAARPDVELWDVQVIPRQGLVRVLIEREGGVDLDLCEEVARLLAPVRERYALEVSSPGIERPLVRTSHFARAIGETVHVRLSEPRDGRRNLRGTLVAADDDELRLDLGGDDGVVAVPRAAIARSNIVWNPVEL